MPPNGELRENWIRAVETKSKQTFDLNSIRYLICELHFDPGSIANAKCRKDLKSTVVPSIFPSSKEPDENEIAPKQRLDDVDEATVNEPDQNMNLAVSFIE